MIITMRTTLNLPDDVAGVLRALAEAKGVSIGDAAAELIRRGLLGEARLDNDGGVPCFSVPSGAEPITLAHTLAMEDEA
jgi:hypothetical protein